MAVSYKRLFHLIGEQYRHTRKNRIKRLACNPPEQNESVRGFCSLPDFGILLYILLK